MSEFAQKLSDSWRKVWAMEIIIHQHAGETEAFNCRNDARRWAANYARCRGWTVALTPPQRQKGTR